jgi:hypothetical protein
MTCRDGAISDHPQASIAGLGRAGARPESVDPILAGWRGPQRSVHGLIPTMFMARVRL